MRNDWSAISTCRASRSASEYTATRGKAQITAGPDDADRDLASIGDQDLRFRRHGWLAIIGDPPEGVKRMLTAMELERALADLGLEAPVRFDEVTGSTNATAVGMAEAGAPEWTLVAAGHQTAGRGRLDRTWEDVPDRALLFSVVLRPTWLPPDRAGILPLAAGVAMTTAAGEVARQDVRCKWPNDLLLDDRKVGGILTESRVSAERIEYAVVGIGVNLDPPAGVDGAAGMGDVEASVLLRAFLRSFVGSYPTNASAFVDGIVAAYPQRSATIGREVEAATTDRGHVRGRAIGVDDAGSLVVDTPAGRERITSGEVTHLR